MSSLRRKALAAAVFAGLGAIPSHASHSLGRREDSVSLNYASFPGTYADPLPKGKRRSTKASQRRQKKQKGVSPSRKKHRMNTKKRRKK